jgi:hypothetical protein
MKKGYLRNVVNEAYVNGGSSSQFVYILIDATPYEFDVYGIYSDEEIARRALQTMQKEEGEGSTRFELKRVRLNEEPGYNYIPNE